MFASSPRRWSRQLSMMAMASVALATMTSCLVVPTVTPTACGDSTVDELVGEQCDDGGESAVLRPRLHEDTVR